MEPDPIVIGKKDGQLFLIARWGDVLDNFEQLAKRAKARWIKEKTADIEAAMSRQKRDLEQLEHLAVKFFRGESVYIGY